LIKKILARKTRSKQKNSKTNRIEKNQVRKKCTES